MISLIIPCKKRLNHLAKTINSFRKQSGVVHEIVVVDYNCPDKTFEYIVKNFSDDKRIKPILADVKDNEWNLSKARNIGYKNSIGELICFLDADTTINHNFLNHHSKKIGKDEFYTGELYHCSGCCIIRREHFEMSGGYNELQEKWGSEDVSLYDKLKRIQILEQKFFKRNLIRNMPHKDELRNQFHGGANIHVTNHQNYLIHQSGKHKGI